MKPGEPAQTTSENYPRRADTWALPKYRSQPVGPRRSHDLTAQSSGTRVRDTPGGIDRNLLHPRQVDYQAVRRAPAQMTVTARPHGDFQTMSPRELDRI